MPTQYETLAKAADAVAARLGRAPVGVVLGSGLSEALDGMHLPRSMEYGEIPGMPTTGVSGHRGALMHGTYQGIPVLALCGRVHLYEGRPLDEVATPIRLLSLLGVHTIVITSTVASVDPELPVGSIMLVEDHVNMSGRNVLAHPHDERLGTRFVDMSQPYDPSVGSAIEKIAAKLRLPLTRGVLANVLGPSYETKVEARFAQSLGARVISMSMVPDVLVARQRGMRVGGLACVAKMSAALADHVTSHERMLVASAGLAADIETLLGAALPQLAQ